VAEADRLQREGDVEPYNGIYAAYTRRQGMQRTQIYLSNSGRQGLQLLALSSGRSQSALIREGIESLLERHQPENRLARLLQARGLWAGRDDLPSWPDLRRELDRQPMAGSGWTIQLPRHCWWWIPTC
jgi:hypothetical protein